MMQSLDASEVATQATTEVARPRSDGVATEPVLGTVSVRNLCAFAAKEEDQAGLAIGGCDEHTVVASERRTCGVGDPWTHPN